jgi:hypothetical protein
MRSAANLISCAVLVATLAIPSTLFAGMGAKKGDDLGADLTVRHENGIDYVSGGVGDDQQSALNAAASRFNLKVTLAAHGGKYLGGADIRITDDKGQEVLATHADGPLFMAKLPPGGYTVQADAEGKSFSQKVNISGQGQQQIVMRWPATVAGDEPLR